MGRRQLSSCVGVVRSGRCFVNHLGLSEAARERTGEKECKLNDIIIIIGLSHMEMETDVQSYIY
jgi:hypothetical protein